jgi:hypothetical protein
VSPPLPRGITLLDLVTQIPQSLHETIPAGIARLLEHLSVVETRSRASGAFDIVEGTARSVVDMLGIDIGDGFTAEIPAVTDGLRFTFASGRTVLTAPQNLEPAPGFWQLSLHVDRLLVPIPGSAAVPAETTPGFIGPLIDDPDRDRVHLWVAGVVLIDNNGGNGPVRASVDATPDPLVPSDPSGAILSAGFDPAHMLFGTSGFGMTIGEVVWDQTVAVTPPEIVARGHDAAWRGLSVSDATLHLPRDLPFVGDVVAGVRDLLIGFDPDNGVQLEAFLQLGETSRLDVADGDPHKVTLWFYQDVDGQIVELPTPAGPGNERHVPVTTTAAGDPVRILARLDPPEAEARWRLPGTTTWITGNETPWVTVEPGDPRSTLGHRDIFVLEDGREADGPKITFAFVDGNGQTSDSDRFPPTIDVVIDPLNGSGPFRWRNVTHLAGRPDDVLGVVFEAAEPLPTGPAAADIERYTWSLDHAGSPLSGTGGRYDPALVWRHGHHELLLTDHRGRHRRLLVDVVTDADRLVIGCAGNDAGEPGPRLLVDETSEEPATPTSVVGSFHLRRFHTGGETVPAIAAATVAGQPAELTVPPGTLAEVTLDHPGDPASQVVGAFRVLMEFDATDPVAYRPIHADRVATDQPGFEGTHLDPWGPADPYPSLVDGAAPVQGGDELRGLAEGSDANEEAARQLRAWAGEVLAADGDAHFVVIGRTCDIGGIGPYNDDLGGRRAAHGHRLLHDADFPGTPVDDERIYWRGENLDEDSATGTMPADPTVFGNLTEPDHTDRSLASRTTRQMRIATHFGHRFAEWGERREIPEREEARGFDVYAVATTPSLPSPSERDAATRRRTLVPGPDQWATIAEAPSDTALSWALRVLARWDSPTWVDAQDSAPTLVELAFEWENATLDLDFPDGSGSNPVDLEPTVDSDETKVWQVVLRYTHDPRTRQMVISGALDTPGNDEGILRLAEPASGGSGIASDVALALGLGPALATGVDSAGMTGGAAATLAALLGVAAASAIFDVASDGVTTLHRLEFGYGRAAGGGLGGGDDGGGASTPSPHRIWLLADYTAGFTARIGTEDNPLLEGRDVQLRYRRTGIELGASTNPLDLERVGIVYEEAAEVVAPGDWSLNTALARLLGIENVRMGAGSVWVEVDLVLAIALGPITLEKATLRLTLDTGRFELRGLTLTVDVPSVVSGTGQLAITQGPDDSDQTEVSAALDLAIEPIGLGIEASFLYLDPMLRLDVGVQFATPIPILGTGLGLFGLNGRFVSNGTRLIPALGEGVDPVQRELDWLAKDLDDKYESEPGQVAVGLGATVGTQPDTGFTFSLNGMLTVELPDPSVVLTVEGRFLSSPTVEATDQAEIGGGLLGIISIGGDGLAVGIRGGYGVPSLIDVDVPVAAWFPFTAAGGDAYVRIGSDGFGGRNGDPVTVTVLPGTLDLQAWAYLMIEEKQLLTLGGHPGFDLTGFSVGFGAGYDFEWGGSVVYLRAGSSIVVGLGTDPLFIRGILETGGELRLGPAGISIDGTVDLEVGKKSGSTDETAASLDGTFEGEVDLGFFSMSGKVEIHIGNVPGPVEEPPPLVTGMSLTDRFARVVATATDGDTPGDQHTAWPDARPTLHFARPVVDGLEGDSFRPTPDNGWGADWIGSARTKYLYRLLAVELVDDVDQVIGEAPDWPSIWWLPAGRPAIPVEGDAPASEHEAWDLCLLAWDPAPWARAMLDGGESAEGDPATVIDRLCDPVPTTTPHCLFGHDGARLDPHRVLFARPSDAPLPWRSGATLTGIETLGLDPEASPWGVLLDDLDAADVWAELFGYLRRPSGVVDLPASWGDGNDGEPVTAGWRLPTYQRPSRDPLTFGLEAVWSTEVVEPDLVVAVAYELPAAGDEFEVVVGFDEFGDDLPPTLDYGLLRVTGHEGDVVSIPLFDWSYALRFRELVIDIGYELGSIVYGPANRVEARMAHIGNRPAVMVAYDADGVEIARDEPPAGVGQNEAYTLVVSRPGIAQVRLFAEPGVVLPTLLIDALAVQMTIDYLPGAIDDLVETFGEIGTLLAPPCFGRTGPCHRRWIPELLDVLADDHRVAAVIRYAPDPLDADDTGPWWGIWLEPTPLVDVVILRSCFITASAAGAAQAADDARTDLADEWSSVVASRQERVVLLEPGREWRVRVRYEVATWQAGDGNPPAPPPAATFDWESPPAGVTTGTEQTQEFWFRTAEEAELPERDLLRFDVQHVFDPRALARYVIGFDPERTPPRHFLDDCLLVHFEVEWVANLLDGYGYDLSLDVARTDPPPGTPSDYDDRLVASTVLWSSNTSTMQATKADSRMAVAALLAGCVPGPLPQGVIACVDAELEARASYDLVVRAVPRTALGQPVDIARINFTASAYRDADGLYRAMGLDPAAPTPDPIYPFEYLVVPADPADVVLDERLRDDVALDEALSLLGLDPLPVPDEPSLQLLWLHDGDWKIAGVLIDSTEALERAPRLEDILLDSPSGPATITQAALADPASVWAAQVVVDGGGPDADGDGWVEGEVVDYVEAPLRLGLPTAEIAATDGTVFTLTPRRSNGSATRVLLGVAAPFVPGAAVLTVRWTDRGRSRSAAVHVPTVPRLVSQELS